VVSRAFWGDARNSRRNGVSISLDMSRALPRSAQSSVGPA